MNINYNNNFYISNSQIHGVGVFAKKDINKNSTIGIVMINKIPLNIFFIPNITDDFGKYINHSNMPNSYLSYDSKKHLYYLKSSKNIKQNMEITANYNNNTPLLIEGSKEHYI